MANETLLSLFDKLRPDHRRETHPFNKSIQEANASMHVPFASSDDIAEALRLWCANYQPCLFGQQAARQHQIQFYVLTERDLADGDEEIEARIGDGIALWKQRALTNLTNPPHGFLLVFSSPRVTAAAPDENLKRFAERLLAMTGWAAQRQRRPQKNPVSSDFLYLRHPKEDQCYGFQFNIDFFAAAGDRRWWHDHRLPGGIGFTANSAGHMLHFREWYGNSAVDYGQWAVRLAMMTIAQAHPTKLSDDEEFEKNDRGGDPEAEGRVTWLTKLDRKGQPFLSQVPCPLSPVPKLLEGKDWTRYEGILHTDHAIRAEFFEDREKPSTRSRPYRMDFTYLYDKAQEDFQNFSAGVPTAEEKIYAEIGAPETWNYRSQSDKKMPERTLEQEVEMARLLDVCRKWKSVYPPMEDQGGARSESLG